MVQIWLGQRKVLILALKEMRYDLQFSQSKVIHESWCIVVERWIDRYIDKQMIYLYI